MVGVAAGATVISVKVLSNNGTGTVSGLLSGLDYVAANGVLGDVANLSLICNAFPVVDSTVLAASAKVKFAMGAGNYGQDADYYSPARADGKNLYTVSAMDNFDGWASFSNYGKHIDYCAPGVSILSLFINGSMAWMSGTSMATPHVTGLLLIGKIKQDGFVTGNPDKRRYPIAHTDRQRNN